MKKVGEIRIKNRPLAHYLLSLLSLGLQGFDEIHLKSYGSLIGKATDISNLLVSTLLVDTFQLDVKNSIEEVQMPSLHGEASKCKASVSTISLEFLRPVAPILERVAPGAEISEFPSSQINVFDLELLLALLNGQGVNALQVGIERIDFGKSITPFDLWLMELNLAERELILGEDTLDPERALRDVASLPRGDTRRVEATKRMEKLKNIRSALVNALIRAGLLKPDLESYQFHLSQWDDVVLGLDTQLLYFCALTACLLDGLMKIPSGDFIDSPDWMTLVISKVGVAEIEHRAHRSPVSWDRRESLRAIQEIMLLNRSKDLEGVSFFLVGSVPPEVDFNEDTTTMRDFLIREHFRTFLKQLDFYKGSYFATADFSNATLAEAEGLGSLYVRKPELDRAQYQLLPAGETNASEILYELAVAFQPLVIRGDGVKLNLHSNWRGKTLENWENWDLRVEWMEDRPRVRPRLDELSKTGPIAAMVGACQELKKYRYVTWVK